MTDNCNAFKPLEVVALENQIAASFCFNPKKFLKPGVCITPFVDCVTKMTGTIRNGSTPINFIACVKFRIKKTESGLEAVITNINISEINIVGKYAIPPVSCGNFKLYYNVNEADSSFDSEIIDDANELIVYKVITEAFENSNLTVLPDNLCVEFVFQTTTEPYVSFVEGGVVLDNTDCNNKNFNKYAITGCKSGPCPCPCPLPPFPSIKKLIIIILRVLIVSILLSIFDPCCKYLPPVFCRIQKTIKKLLLPSQEEE